MSLLKVKQDNQDTLPNRNNHDEVIEIINNFQGKINKVLNNTHSNDRNDLEQEIKIKICEKVEPLLKENNTPGFWEFIGRKNNDSL